MLGSSWVAAQLAASQEGLSSMCEYVSYSREKKIYLKRKITHISELIYCWKVFAIFNILLCNKIWSAGRYGAVGMATGYELDGRGVRVRVLVGDRRRPDRFWGPPGLLFNGYRGLSPRGQSSRGMKLTTHVQLMLRSRIRGCIHLLPRTSSWRSA
jgi:hypothetical protein